MAIMLGVGGRLLFAAARSRRAPEAAIGASAAFGALAVILSLTATSVLARDPDASWIWALGRIAQAIGIGALAVGCWRIYRPGDAWAAAVAAMACAGALTACALRTMLGSIPAPGQTGLGALLSTGVSIFIYGWATGESIRYHVQLKRRLALGLADPVVVHQFLLWAVSGSCALASTVTSAFFAFVLGRATSSVPSVFVAVQIALFCAAVSLWFAFFPPGFYRRRLAGTGPARDEAT